MHARYHKADRDETIAYLEQKYPKCFFSDPGYRRPLKKNIIDDLDRERVLDHERLCQTIDWYQAHFAYQYSLVAGAERLDLDGKKVGTVTVQEQQEAVARIAARKRELKDKQTALVAKVAVKGNGADPVVTKPISPTHPLLADMQEAINVVGTILTEKHSLRWVLATTALREIISRAEKLIDAVAQDAHT